MLQYKNVEGELQEIENLTKELQLNLGALLHHRYKYTRGGGIVDRTTASANSKKFKRKVWGASTLPSPNYQSYTTQIQEFEEKGEREEIKKFLEMFVHYTHTQELLSKNEDTLLHQKEQKNLNYYKKSISEIFGRPICLTPVNLYSKVFEIGIYKGEESSLGTSSPNGE